MTIADEWSACRPLRFGWAVLALLIFGFGGWAGLTPIAGAIVAPGQVDVDLSRQVVQHPEGGRVDAVMVREGDTVSEGEVLMRLDGAQIRSDLAVCEADLAGALAQIGRLEAERDGLAAIRFAPALADLSANESTAADLVHAQERIFRTRAESFGAQIEQLDRRRDQIAEEVRGLAAQIDAAARQHDFAAGELETQQGLLGKGLTVGAHVADLGREVARLDGVIGGLVASKAEAESRSAENDLAILQLTANRREQALSDLHDLTARAAELGERRRALADRIARLDLRAPVSGRVLGLQISGPGAVLRPADPALYIVPQGRPFVIEARVALTDIDEVWPGQPATLRIAAFDSRKTPDLSGRLTTISADVIYDQAHAQAYYRARIEVPAAEVARLAEAPLVPGMPAEVFLRTRDRTPLGYLLMPVENFFHRAFRES